MKIHFSGRELEKILFEPSDTLEEIASVSSSFNVFELIEVLNSVLGSIGEKE